MRVLISQMLLDNLEGKLSEHHHLYRTKEKAYEQLKHFTGQDFGYDVQAWEEWIRNAERPFPNLNRPKE